MFLAALTLALLGTSPGSVAAEPVETNKFLKLGEGERYWYLEGAVSTVSHLISMRDQKKGECVASWYLKDRDNKRKLIEQTLAKYPTDGPTTIVIGLLTQACGDLSAK